MKELSIIVPTYNRQDTIRKVLESLDSQTTPKSKYEVIVVDDGSNYDVKNFIKGFNVKYIRQKNSGPAKARNLGVKNATARLVAFIGDDTVLDKRWVAEHLKTHKEKGENVAVLGFTAWGRDQELTNFMKYLAPQGPQFNYGAIKNKDNCGFDFFWTSNISLEKKWFEKDKFDEKFPYAAYEDLELSYRLHKKGLRIVYNPKAIVNHYHHYTPDKYFKKQSVMAESALIFARKHPKLRSFLIDKNKITFAQALARYVLLVLPKTEFLQRLFWKLQRRYYFTKALKSLPNRI